MIRPYIDATGKTLSPGPGKSVGVQTITLDGVRLNTEVFRELMGHNA